MPDGGAVIDAHWIAHERIVALKPNPSFKRGVLQHDAADAGTDGSGKDANSALSPIHAPLEAEFEVPALVVAVQAAFEEERALVAAAKAAAAAADEAMIAAEQLRLQTEAAERAAADAKAKTAAAAGAKGKGKPPLGGTRSAISSSRATAAKPKTPETSRPKTPVAITTVAAAKLALQKPRTPLAASGGSAKPATPSAKPATPSALRLQSTKTASPIVPPAASSGTGGRNSPAAGTNK